MVGEPMRRDSSASCADASFTAGAASGSAGGGGAAAAGAVPASGGVPAPPPPPPLSQLEKEHSAMGRSEAKSKMRRMLGKVGCCWGRGASQLAGLGGMRRLHLGAPSATVRWAVAGLAAGGKGGWGSGARWSAEPAAEPVRPAVAAASATLAHFVV